MTISDLRNHYNNLVLLEEAELAYSDIISIQAIDFNGSESRSSGVPRPTEVKTILAEKQSRIISELQAEIEAFNREELQPFLSTIDDAHLKVYNCLWLRYVSGYRWDEIASFFKEGADASKRRCYRYLREHLEP